MAAMTTAERRGFQQVCGADGAVLVVAADQRGGMRRAMAATPEEEAAIDVPALARAKFDIATHLARHAGCILLDPVCAVPAVVDEGVLDRGTALLVGLDASGWDATPEGFRVSVMVEGVTARRVRGWGGTGGKVMVYLRADRPEANRENLATLARVVEDFAAEDLLLVVEFLTYALPGEDPEGFAALSPDLVLGGVRLCLEAGAKVLKIPYPGSPEACAAVSKAAGEVPWAVLSAGVDHATFLGQVEAAMANGARGVIAGRSLWKDCVSTDRERTRERLTRLAVPRLEEIKAVLARHAPARPALG